MYYIQVIPYFAHIVFSHCERHLIMSKESLSLTLKKALTPNHSRPGLDSILASPGLGPILDLTMMVVTTALPTALKTERGTLIRYKRQQ